MAFLVLISTFSFTVEKHYCGDFLVDVSYFGEADSCGMKMDGLTTKKKKNCCKDEVLKIEGQDELQKQFSKTITFKQQQFVVAFVYSYNTSFFEINLEKEFYKNFSPPDIELDYQVVYQSFLI